MARPFRGIINIKVLLSDSIKELAYGHHAVVSHISHRIDKAELCTACFNLKIYPTTAWHLLNLVFATTHKSSHYEKLYVITLANHVVRRLKHGKSHSLGNPRGNGTFLVCRYNTNEATTERMLPNFFPTIIVLRCFSVTKSNYEYQRATCVILRELFSLFHACEIIFTHCFMRR
jgi:hypothetical protein